MLVSKFTGYALAPNIYIYIIFLFQSGHEIRISHFSWKLSHLVSSTHRPETTQLALRFVLCRTVKAIYTDRSGAYHTRRDKQGKVPRSSLNIGLASSGRTYATLKRFCCTQLFSPQFAVCYQLLVYHIEFFVYMLNRICYNADFVKSFLVENDTEMCAVFRVVCAVISLDA